MTHTRPQPAGILVVANRTCPCPMLLDEVARRVSDAPIDVLVVVPALNSRLRHWLSDIDDAVARAHDRLEVALADLRTRGVNARGEVGDANPLVGDRRRAGALSGFGDRDRDASAGAIELARARTDRQGQGALRCACHASRGERRTGRGTRRRVTRRATGRRTARPNLGPCGVAHSSGRVRPAPAPAVDPTADLA